MNKTLFFAACSLGALYSCTSNNTSEEMKSIPFTAPTTATCDSVDTYFGEKIADPYQWLEDDYSEPTTAWVKEQNKATQSYLSQIPQREGIRKRLTELWKYEKYGIPFKKNDITYYFKNDGIQNQSVLYKVNSQGNEEVVLDPNQLSADGTVALGALSISKNGKYLAYSTSQSGSDWNSIQVMDLETKELLKDKVDWVKFSGIAWQGDGFYYSGYDAPKEGEEYSQKNEFHKIKFHKLGTTAQEDAIVVQDLDNPQRNFYCTTSEDEKYVLVTSSESTSGSAFGWLANPKAKVHWFDTSFDFEHSFVGMDNGNMLFMTNDNAPNYKLVSISPSSQSKTDWNTVIAESNHVMDGVSLAGGKLLVSYLEDVVSHLYIYSTVGEKVAEVQLPGVGTLSGLEADKDESEAYFSFTNYTTPPTIYSLNIADNSSEVYRAPEVNFNPDDFVTEQVKYKSKDGTEIPMFITYKKGLEKTGNNPCFLYGYGGFSISLKPSFSIKNIPFIEKGGIYVVANLRGGNEYGEEWHKAGIKTNKQNVFDDFIAAAEYLIAEKYTSSEKLAIHGRSNGGLLAGAVLTQRPDLMKVALPKVGVLDMLKYHQFTIGWAWAADYGRSDDSPEMYEYLKGYSPLHNVKDIEYPATMVVTGDHDDRVVPAHSFKFGATLQAHQKGSQPIVIRIDENAGHGAGKPVSKQIAEFTDEWAFVCYHLGMNF